jgi:hypothetical protein
MNGSDGASFMIKDTLHFEGVAADVDGLCILRSGHLLAWRMVSSGSQAILVDTITGNLTTFGSGDTLVGREIRGAAVDGFGQVWALDAASASAIKVDTVNGSILHEVPLVMNGAPWMGCPLCDITFTENTCFLTGENGFYVLDTISGYVSLHATDTQSDPGDILYTCNGTISNPPPINRGVAYLGDGNTIVTFDSACEDDLFSYSLNGFGDRQEVLHHIIPSFNSGGGDLASAIPLLTTAIRDPSGELPTFNVSYTEGMLTMMGVSTAHSTEISVHDGSGKTVYSDRRVVVPSLSIPLQLSDGLYLVRIIEGTFTQTTKLIVAR